jgi:[ribosomal protein S5]-alanine N-acetyltransferase
MTQAIFPQTHPKVETERLVLREISHDDTAAIFRNFSDPDVANWFFEKPHSTMEQTIKVIDHFILKFKQGEGLTWAITLKEDGQVIGTCGYENIEIGNRGEIGFDLAKDCWGKGYMRESLAAIINFGFSILNLSKIEAHTNLNNVRAKFLLEKLGFQLDKVSKGNDHYILSKKT